MITKNIIQQPKSQIEVQVTVPWADIEPKWNETLTSMAQEVELPGFRKGQAPLQMVEQNLGQKLQDEVLKAIMPQALIDALQGTTVVPIDYPKYQVVSFQKGAELRFSATITQRPVIKVGDYKNIKVTKPQPKVVSDDEVNKIIDELFKRWKLRQPQQPATPPTGGPASGPISEPTNGASGSLNFNQPAPVSSDLPDDTFAKAVGATNLEDLKTKMKQDLENESKYNNELDYEEAILQEVEKITDVDIPDVLIEDELNRMLVSLQRTVSDRGMLIDDYLKSQNKTVDQLKNDWKPQAEKNVRMELGLAEVARLEGVNISDEELQAEIDKIQDAKVKAQFNSQEPKMHLRHALRQTKTLNLLKTVVGS